MVENKTHYLGTEQILRHIDYEPLDVSVNVKMEWKNQMYKITKMWSCDGDCSYKAWNYAMTRKIIDLIAGTIEVEA